MKGVQAWGRSGPGGAGGFSVQGIDLDFFKEFLYS